MDDALLKSLGQIAGDWQLPPCRPRLQKHRAPTTCLTSLLIGAALLYLFPAVAIADPQSATTNVTADHGGIVVNGNISGSFGLTPGQLSELMSEYARQGSAADQTVRTLSRQLGVTEAALGSFFKILEQNDIPPEQLAVRLTEIARDHKRLLAELAVFRGEDDSDVAHLSVDAETALRDGRIEDARRLLTKAKAANIAAADRLHTAMNAHKRRAAVKAAALGNLANSEFNYPRAAAAFTEAATLCPPDDALLRADYLNSAAVAEHGAGRYPVAVPLFTEALAIREKALGPAHPDTATSLNNLALLYQAQGKLADATPLYTRALAIREKALGPDHPDTATSLNNLALLYQAQGKLADAAPLYTRALAIREKALSPDHPDTATSLNNLASLYQAQGKLADAVPLDTRALAINERLLGPDHPETARSLNNLALLYQAQGRPDAAAPLYTRALTILEKVLGSEHPDIARTLNNLALLYQAQGKLNEAVPLYTRALAIYERLLGPEHPDVAVSLNNLAGLYRKQDRLEDATTLYTQALAIQEKSLGSDHPAVAISLNNLAGLYFEKKRLNTAASLYTRAVAIQEKSLGPDHSAIATSLYNLALLYTAQDRLDTAIPLYFRAQEIRDKGLGFNYSGAGTNFINLALLDVAQENVTSTRKNFGDLGIGEMTFNSGLSGSNTERPNLIGVSYVEEQIDITINHIRNGLLIIEEKYGPNSPAAISLIRAEAKLRQQQGLLKEAAALLANAKEREMRGHRRVSSPQNP